MKNFFHAIIASDLEKNLNEQNLPTSIELNEMELENATGGHGNKGHRYERHDHRHHHGHYDQHDHRHHHHK